MKYHYLAIFVATTVSVSNAFAGDKLICGLSKGLSVKEATAEIEKSYVDKEKNNYTEFTTIDLQVKDLKMSASQTFESLSIYVEDTSGKSVLVLSGENLLSGTVNADNKAKSISAGCRIVRNE